jgi:hypothetical protein
MCRNEHLVSHFILVCKAASVFIVSSVKQKHINRNCIDKYETVTKEQNPVHHHFKLIDTCKMFINAKPCCERDQHIQ